MIAKIVGIVIVVLVGSSLIAVFICNMIRVGAGKDE